MVFCTKCGSAMSEGSVFCPACGSTIQAAPPAPATQRYGGFWIRVLATIIDGCVLNVAGLIIALALLPHNIWLLGRGSLEDLSDLDEARIIGLFSRMLVLIPIVFVMKWLYYAWLESSEKQATLGKMALGLKVTDLAGNRISFGRATGRHFAKMVSSLILCIGYIMVAFSERKQGLHDMMASTLVTRP